MRVTVTWLQGARVPSLPAVPPCPVPCVPVQGSQWQSELEKVSLKELLECVLLLYLQLDLHGLLFMRIWKADLVSVAGGVGWAGGEGMGAPELQLALSCEK